MDKMIMRGKRKPWLSPRGVSRALQGVHAPIA